MAIKKGLGVVLTVFVLAILGIVFIDAIGDSIVGSTELRSVTNETLIAAASGSTVQLQGKAVSGTPTVRNGSVVFDSGNWTVLDNQIAANGDQVAQLRTDDAFMAGLVNVTYDYQPTGYVSTSSGRSLTTLILIMFAIAILIVVMAGIFNNPKAKKILGLTGGR